MTTQNIKLRKNDYQELRKLGAAAIEAKLVELALAYQAANLLKMKNELKNLRELSNLRDMIAKLKTIKAELKETK